MREKKEKTYSFLHQVLVMGIVLFISKIIESFMPIPMPASVIGLVLLFILLCTGIVKLGQVESVGTALTNNIGFLFVPAGVSVVNSLGVLSQSPFLIIALIIVSTILLLVCTGFASQLIMKFTMRTAKTSENSTQSQKSSRKMKGAHTHV
ncbi:antiholin-like murein hydrolase modulator LrgA [Staphylococcus canis]|uniref:Antiholin-like murein hydrolase modulator LrgA n=1 Tax=Staphylococcus canis TaxID=2724942 RepID=A0ABS0T9H5_9STAP|nr:antiholin-like murein hydrolase modulator LrgA [Staphylococcus canis]MBI5974428.1 antiholin-like murein hydrolase modulator LrgA [Staphylococcus canis]